MVKKSVIESRKIDLKMSVWMKESGEEADDVNYVNYVNYVNEVNEHEQVTSNPKEELITLNKVLLQVLKEEYVDKYAAKIEERAKSLMMHPDSGFDLFVTEDIVIPAGEIKMINMQVKCAVYGNYKGSVVPLPYYLYPRSSVIKRGIMMANSVGIIDSGYRGPLMAGFYNTRSEDVEINAGERIVQICLSDISPYYNVTLTDEIEKTERDEGGIGSTGL